jgi:hypothetical protein
MFRREDTRSPPGGHRLEVTLERLQDATRLGREARRLISRTSLPELPGRARRGHPPNEAQRLADFARKPSGRSVSPIEGLSWPAQWTTVTKSATIANDLFGVRMDAKKVNQFFRLKKK